MAAVRSSVPRSLPAPLYVDKQRRFHGPIQRTLASLHDTRQLFRNINTRHPLRSRRSHERRAVELLRRYRLERRFGAARLAGPAQQIQDGSLVARAEVLNDRPDARNHNGVPVTAVHANGRVFGNDPCRTQKAAREKQPSKRSRREPFRTTSKRRRSKPEK